MDCWGISLRKVSRLLPLVLMNPSKVMANPSPSSTSREAL